MNSILRKAEDRGAADFGWLKSAHTFSFGRYFDSRHMGFGVLRVINEDRVAPGKGFDAHPHKDMEILSFVVDGALEHQDSMGNGSVIRPGELQRMSAGTGVVHSEYNASKTDPVHFLQIWIQPRENDLAPGYEQKHFPTAERQGKFRLIASPSGRDGALSLAQDVELFSSILQGGDEMTYPLRRGRAGWLQAVRGSLEVNGDLVTAGDGLAFERDGAISLSTDEDAEILFFDLPAV